MITWSVGFTDPGGTYAAYHAGIESCLLAAGERWSDYLTGSGSIQILVQFQALGNPGPLASGGGGYNSNTQIGTEGGVPVWQSVAAYEIVTGTDTNGATQDITVTVNTDRITDFWFDPAPLLRTDPVPAGKSDFMTVALHELAHPLAFASFRNAAGVVGPQMTPFDRHIVVGGGFQFDGPAAVALYGGNLALHNTSFSHYGNSGGPGADLSLLLMATSFVTGTRRDISAIDIAIMEDAALVVRKPSAGDDWLNGFSTADDIDAGNGHDSIAGREGNDTLRGGNGNDTLSGDRDADLFLGGDGHDEVHGGDGNDVADGGPGNDLFDGGNGGDTLDGGAGTNLVTYDLSPQAVTVNLATNTHAGGTAAGDKLFNIQTVLGSPFGDAITTTATGSGVLGREGDDTLTGGNGSDGLYGETGNDSLAGGGGDDFLDAGSGNDSIDGGAGRDDVYAGDGNDTVAAGDSATIDLVFGGNGNDLIDGQAGADVLFGQAGGDTVIGGNGDDWVQGDDGDDSLSGGAGTLDWLEGGTGNDTIDGGTGQDWLAGGTGGDRFVFDTGAGVNAVADFAAGDTVAIRIDINGATVASYADLLAQGRVTQFGGDGAIILSQNPGAFTDYVLLIGFGADGLSAANVAFF